MCHTPSCTHAAASADDSGTQSTSVIAGQAEAEGQEIPVTQPA